MKPEREVSAQLFCFHHAGGSTKQFTDWKRFLPASIETIPIGLPGRQERFQERLITEFPAALEAVTSMVAPLVNAPFALIGHSMGALLAFEVARNLEQLGLAPSALFVCGCRAPHRWAEDHEMKSHLPDSELTEEIREMHGTAESILSNAELMELLLPMLRADFAVCDSYLFDPQSSVLSCPIFAFGGLEDSDITREDIADWRHLTSGGFGSHMLEGDHFFVQQEWAVKQICSAIVNTFSRVLYRRLQLVRQSQSPVDHGVLSKRCLPSLE
jgi:medium-chain acyl-[acyl-carrier-protein] hydrolase